MHEPKSYGLFSYGEPLTDQDQAFIDHCAKKLTNFKSISNLESLKYTRILPDGGSVILTDIGGVFRAIAFKPSLTTSSISDDGLTHLDVPFLFSGIVMNAISQDDSGIGIRFSNGTRRRMTNYEGMGPDYLDMQRFRCTYAPDFQMFIPELLRNRPGRTEHSQYQQQHATWYSGSMAQVVQIVGAYGRQDFEKLPQEDLYEQLRYTLPLEVSEKIWPEIENYCLPGYSGRAPLNGQYQYNFQFNDTDLIAFDEKREPWLIKINNVGIWAMPLPLVPATTTTVFREYIETIGDSEIEKILNRFGGMPSGEGFPLGAEFYRWVRAGAIIRLGDTGKFFQYSAYSSACGWSSNLDCTEAINTCFDYSDDGFCYGYTFMIRFQMLSAENRGWAKSKQVSQDWSTDERDLLSEYLSKLFNALKESTEPGQLASIRYKLRFVDESEIMDRARSRNGANDIEYWDNLRLDPIAQGKASLVITNEGYLHEGQRIKLPEPFEGGCVSMNFKPLGDKDTYPYIDTIIFAYYIGDTLKVIKNYRDDRKFTEKTISNFEESMIVGNWEEKRLTGGVYNGGDYYSTDFDNRKEIPGSVYTTTIEGKDQGWGKPFASFGFYGHTEGELTRRRYYTHKRIEQSTGNIGMRQGFIVPYLNRNMSFYGHQEWHDQGSYRETLRQYGITDPNSYGFWTYDFSWHWVTIERTMPRNGRPWPVDSFPVWAERYDYEPTANSDFADYGDWIGGLPADVSHIVHPPNGITLISYGGEPPPVEEYTINKDGGRENFYNMGCSVMDRPVKLHDQPHTADFYSLSPNPNGTVVYQDACKVVFGDAEYANISLKNLAGQKYRFGYTRLNETHESKSFIGVINE